MHVPALTITIKDAGRGIGAHDRTAGIVGGLIDGAVIRTLARACRHLGGVHRFGDLGETIGQESRHLQFVVMKIERHPQQRTAEPVLVGRIQIEIAVLVAVRTAVGRQAERALIGFRGRFLPFRAPLRGALRHRPGLDRTRAGLSRAHVTAAKKAQARVIEIVAVVIVDDHAVRAGRDERIEDLVLEDQAHAGGGLIGVVTADNARTGLRIVRFSNARQQHQLDIEERKGAHQHDIGGLFPLFARRINISHAGGALAGRSPD